MAPSRHQLYRDYDRDEDGSNEYDGRGSNGTGDGLAGHGSDNAGAGRSENGGLMSWRTEEGDAAMKAAALARRGKGSNDSNDGGGGILENVGGAKSSSAAIAATDAKLGRWRENLGASSSTDTAAKCVPYDGSTGSTGGGDAGGAGGAGGHDVGVFGNPTATTLFGAGGDAMLPTMDPSDFDATSFVTIAGAASGSNGGDGGDGGDGGGGGSREVYTGIAAAAPATDDDDDGSCGGDDGATDTFAARMEAEAAVMMAGGTIGGGGTAGSNAVGLGGGGGGWGSDPSPAEFSAPDTSILRRHHPQAEMQSIGRGGHPEVRTQPTTTQSCPGSRMTHDCACCAIC